jgi:hypothetical protein
MNQRRWPFIVWLFQSVQPSKPIPSIQNQRICAMPICGKAISKIEFQFIDHGGDYDLTHQNSYA